MEYLPVIAYLAIFALMAWELRRRRDDGPRAAPDLQLVLNAVAKERADFREDLAATTSFFGTQIERMRMEHEVDRKVLLGLVEDQRRHIDGLTATTHSLAVASRAPVVVAGQAPAVHEYDDGVMDDEREYRIQQDRGDNPPIEIDPASADGIVQRAIAGLNGRR